MHRDYLLVKRYALSFLETILGSTAQSWHAMTNYVRITYACFILIFHPASPARRISRGMELSALSIVMTTVIHERTVNVKKKLPEGGCMWPLSSV